MANVATVKSSSPNHLTFELVGDGTVAGPTIANAALLALMEPGPLRNAWDATYADQDAMRDALLGGGAGCDCFVQLNVTPVDTTAETNQVVVDVDVDAVTATKAEINFGMSDTTGQRAYITFRYRHSMIA